MEEVQQPSPSSPEGSNFDNDFEKVPVSGFDDLVSSSTHDEPEEDLYTAGPIPGEAQPLIDLGEPSPAPTGPGIAVCPPKISCPKPPLQPVKESTGSWVTNIDPRATSGLFPPEVLELIYWREPRKTGVVFGSMLVLLLSLALFSLLSVVAYLSLAALTVTVSFRLYKNILGAVSKAEGHPFKQYLEVEICLPEDKVHQAADIIMEHTTTTVKQLRRLFLVEDLVDSVKFGLLLWVLTYIGAWFNGMTILILATIAVFTLPKVYETHKTQIDQHVDLAKDKIREVLTQVKEKIPFGKKKSA